jgi:phytoene desaturase
LEELFSLSGRQLSDYVELLPVYPFYRLHWDDGRTFDYSNNDEKLFEQINSFNPNDVEGYKKFLLYSKAVFKEGYEKWGAVPFLSFWDMIKAAPQLIRLGAHRSVYSMVASYIKDWHLRQAFSFHTLLVGGNPFSSSAIYALIHHLERKWGVFFPRGGTGQLVQGLVKLFLDLGGEIRLNSPIESIETKAGKIHGIKTNSNQVEPFDLVVSNADVVHTYKELLKENIDVRLQAKRLARSRHSMSLFVVYFGTDKKYPGLPQHNIIFGPRYKNLLKDIFQTGVLADDFSLYLHRPTATDPSLAPQDGETFYVLSPVPHLGKNPMDWENAGPVYAARILKFLEEHHLPDLSKHIVTKKIFTPLNFKQELNAHWGSAFSLEPILTQSAYFRVHNRDEKIKNLYFVGAGTHPGAGIPGVVSSAKATVQVILSDWKSQLLKTTKPSNPTPARFDLSSDKKEPVHVS